MRSFPQSFILNFLIEKQISEYFVNINDSIIAPIAPRKDPFWISKAILSALFEGEMPAEKEQYFSKKKKFSHL